MADRYKHTTVTPRPDYSVPPSTKNRAVPTRNSSVGNYADNNNTANRPSTNRNGNAAGRVNAGQTGRVQTGNRPTATQKKKSNGGALSFWSRLSPKGKLKYSVLAVIVLLVIVVIGAAAKGSSGKLNVTTDTSSEQDLKISIPVDAFLTKLDNGYFCDFIDNDYIEHGISNDTTGTLDNPDDPANPYGLVVSEIEAFDENDSGVKYLRDVLAAQPTQADNTDDTDSTDTNNDTADTDADTESSSSEKCFIIKCALMVQVEEELSISPDTKVTINLVTASKEKAVAVPSDAVITNTDGTKSVLTVEKNGKVKVNKVTTGIQTDEFTEITSGITKGQTVIISAKNTEISTIKDGQKVKATAATNE